MFTVSNYTRSRNYFPPRSANIHAKSSFNSSLVQVVLNHIDRYKSSYQLITFNLRSTNDTQNTIFYSPLLLSANSFHYYNSLYTILDSKCKTTAQFRKLTARVKRETQSKTTIVQRKLRSTTRLYREFGNIKFSHANHPWRIVRSGW